MSCCITSCIRNLANFEDEFQNVTHSIYRRFAHKKVSTWVITFVASICRGSSIGGSGCSCAAAATIFLQLQSLYHPSSAGNLLSCGQVLYSGCKSFGPHAWSTLAHFSLVLQMVASFWTWLVDQPSSHKLEALSLAHPFSPIGSDLYRARC